jgi:hypothetical protein
MHTYVNLDTSSVHVLWTLLALVLLKAFKDIVFLCELEQLRELFDALYKIRSQSALR